MPSLLLYKLLLLLLGAPVLADPPPRGAESSSDPFVFFTLGDWGLVGPQQSEVTAAMASWGEASPPHFVLALGDNFYEDGVTSVSDPQWQTTYQEVYTHPSLQCPWYALLGNHDHHTNPEAQIDYYQMHMDDRWVMPDWWYTETFTLPGGLSLEIVFLDTVILAYDSAMAQIRKEQPANHELLSSFAAAADRFKSQGKEQLKWLESTLEASTADWLLVAGHFPAYSGGEHGDTKELKEDVVPLLEKYEVDAYISGHDHNLQHLAKSRDSEKGVQYFVSGSGAKLGTYSEVKQSIFGMVVPGFMVHEVSPDGSLMTVKVVSSQGTVIHQTMLKQRRSRQGPPQSGMDQEEERAVA